MKMLPCLPRGQTALFVCLWIVSTLPGGAAADVVPKGLKADDWSSIQSAYEAGRHAFHARGDGTHAARNPGQRWVSTFDGRGFTATPDTGDWTWGLELRRYGIGKALTAVPQPGEPTATGQRLSCRRDAVLEEWFVNDRRGLEQGWTLNQRPAGDAAGMLRLEFAVRGDLRPLVTADSVAFSAVDGSPGVTYGGLKAWDAAGRALPVQFARAGVGIAIEVAVDQARFPITIDPVAQQADLEVAYPDFDDQFGTAVAVDGDTVVVGAPGESSSATGVNGNETLDGLTYAGAAWVFVRNAENKWVQQAYLKASNTQMGDLFGVSVAISGDTVVVGAEGEDSRVVGNQGDNSGDRVGAAYVFVRSGTAWSQQAYLKASDPDDRDWFGSSVAVAGDTVAVGVWGDDSTATGIGGDPTAEPDLFQDSGAVYVFARSGTSWSQQAYIKAHNAEAGDQFGLPVALSGTTLVVGAYHEDSGATGVNGDGGNAEASSGAAYVFVRDGTAWSQQAYLKASNTGEEDLFGHAVGVSGDTVVVGAPDEDSDPAGGDPTNNDLHDSGAAYVFVRDGTTWSQQAHLKASKPDTNDRFGFAADVSEDFVAVGAFQEDSAATGIDGDQEDNSALEAGAVYAFARLGTLWNQIGYVKPSDTDDGDYFGQELALSGGTLIAASPLKNFFTGSAYVFVLPPNPVTSLAKTGLAAPGLGNSLFTAFGNTAVNGEGEVSFDASMKGSDTSGGRNRAVFSTVATGVVAPVLRSGDFFPFNGGGPLEGKKISTWSPPLLNHPTYGLVPVTFTGTGVTALNNRILIRHGGTGLYPLVRTGTSQDDLGDARFSAFREVLQSSDRNLLAVSYSLQRDRVIPVTELNDSGLLLLDHSDLYYPNTSSRREGAAAFGPGGGSFGQFFGRAALGPLGMTHFGAYYWFPDNTAGGKPVQGLFFTNENGTSTGRRALQGEAPAGTWGALLQSFLGEAPADDAVVFRATLSGMGVTAANNEGLWHSTGGLWMRKGSPPYSGSLEVIKRIVAFWPVESDQMVAQVQLAGPGVTSANNTALLLRQENGSVITLLRAGVEAPELPDATVAVIQKVDVNPRNGHYAILASLKGVPSATNQALWTGQTQLGNPIETSARRPKLSLRKGDPYGTALTPLGVVRGLELKPAVNIGGAGGRGLAQVVGSEGHVILTLTGDLGVRELVLYRK